MDKTANNSLIIGDKPYLIFDLHGLLYGVNALLVQEIFLLPELTPVVEAPHDVVGIINLRGKILPVIDLYLRLGHQPQAYCLSHSVIVLEWQGVRIGMIVNQVHEVKNIDPESVEGEITYGQNNQIHSGLIAGVTKVNTDVIVLLNHERLLRHTQPLAASLSDISENTLIPEQNGKELNGQFTESSQAFAQSSPLSSFQIGFCPTATPQEKAVFRERMQNLIRPIDSWDASGLIPLAVVGLNGEYFGLDLEFVHEFTNIHNLTPIPCCPPHIIGNMNLRGEIVTLIDIRSALNMSTDIDPKRSTGADIAAKAMVVHVNDLIVGVKVDQVFDVMYLRPSDVMPVPIAVRLGSDEYLRGTAPYDGKMLSLLNLPKILLQEDWIVNQEV
jgi:purine-binding chemotaxis protein CheW